MKIKFTRREMIGSLAAAAAWRVAEPLRLFPKNSMPMGRETAHSDPWSRYWIGTAYYPEQWPSKQWPGDFAKMKELGVNAIRVGEFAWSSLEPSPARFEFDWLDEVISLAQKNDISVILGTPTAAIPPWLYKLHPDTLGANAKGPYTYGGRKGFSLFSPAMRNAAHQVIGRLASRYGENPAVMGWQLSNEPGYPMVSFEPSALVAFRLWLKRRYGSIAKLNAAWSGAFWSNEYNDWDEIMFPTNSAEGGWYPGIRLDYRRFFSDSFLNWLRFEAGIVRASAKHQFLYTNWPGPLWDINVREAGSFLDANAWDNYGQMPGAGDPHGLFYYGIDHDLCRCARSDQRFFVAEQPSQPPADLSTRAVRLATYIDLAHGAYGTLFFEWRPPAIGAERGTVSMLEADGSFGRSHAQFVRLARELATVGPLLAGARTTADIAVAYSYANQWEQDTEWLGRGDAGRPYAILCHRYYVGARSFGRNVDVVSPAQDWDNYRVVVAPGLHLVSDENAERIRQYVHRGGILVLDHGAGTLDESGRLRPLMEPGVFGEMAGVRVPASWNLPANPKIFGIQFEHSHRIYPADGSLGDGESAIARVELRGAEVLARFTGEGMEGLPAVTLNAFGRGHVVFVAGATRDAGFLDTLCGILAARFRIPPLLAVPKGVTVLSRHKNGKEYLFVLNLNREGVEFNLPRSYQEILSRKVVEGMMRIGGLDLAILETA